MAFGKLYIDQKNNFSLKNAITVEEIHMLRQAKNAYVIDVATKQDDIIGLDIQTLAVKAPGDGKPKLTGQPHKFDQDRFGQPPTFMSSDKLVHYEPTQIRNIDIYLTYSSKGVGGVWNAFADAEDIKAKSFALFLRNQRAWQAKPLEDNHITKWKEASKGMPLHLVLPHGSYLMNLGSPKEDTLNKSRTLFVEELDRCHKLGIPHFNFHPGSSCGEMSREKCCLQIAESINIAHEQTKGSEVIAVLENMCGQGNTVGGDLHELRIIIQNVNDKSRVGVCIDTCHANAAGYDLGSEEGFEELINDFGKIIGWQFLRGLHINDSKGKAGDHLDRHENIGKGTIGIEGFRRIMNCEYFTDMPLILETPYTTNDGYGKEIVKLERLIKKEG
ncbi:unnamed protein product, partial [Meganyctiphanes norvegica]